MNIFWVFILCRVLCWGLGNSSNGIDKSFCLCGIYVGGGDCYRYDKKEYSRYVR